MYRELWNIMNENSHTPTGKFLTIVACNTDSMLKLESTTTNIKNYLCFPNNDIIVIDSEDATFGAQLNENIKFVIKQHYLIPNDKYCDFGKWCYVLKNSECDYSTYDSVIFLNDSVSIKNSINHFYNIVTKTDVELYAYNDTKDRIYIEQPDVYHYQSYLFSIKPSSCNKLIRFLDNNKVHINSFLDLIQHIEIPLLNIFDKKDCFLKLANNPSHSKNIFFHNDNLYKRLFINNLLPFIKIKRITSQQ